MILSSILPGLRDIRLPLSVGLTWLAVCWFWFRDRLPPSGSRDGVIGGAYELVSLIGPSASLSILVFVGYLVGALLTFNFLREIPLSYLIRGRNPFDRSGFFLGAFKPIDDGRVEELRSTISSRVRSVADRGVSKEVLEAKYGFRDDEEQGITGVILDSIVREQSSIADGLSLNHPDRFEKFDRLQSEAQFRQAISFPMAVLVIVLAIESSNWLVALAILPVAALWFQGVRRAQGARSILFSNVLDGTIVADALAGLEELRP